MHPIDVIKQFAIITPEVEERFRAAVKERLFRRGERVSGASQLSASAYFIQSGAARVFFLKDGKEHTISFSFDDQFITVSPFTLAQVPETITVEFLESTVALYIPHVRVKDILLDGAQFNEKEALIFFNSALAAHCRELEERIFMSRTSKAPELYNWAITRYPRLTEVANITQIASFLGLTRETLYRIRSNTYKQ